MLSWFKFMQRVPENFFGSTLIPLAAANLLGDVFGAGQCEELLVRRGVSPNQGESARWRHPAPPDACLRVGLTLVDEVILSLGGLLPGAPMRSQTDLLPDSAKGSSHFWKVALFLDTQCHGGSPLPDTQFGTRGPRITVPQLLPACLGGHEGQSIIAPQAEKSAKF